MRDDHKTKAQLIAELKELRAKASNSSSQKGLQEGRFKQMIDDLPQVVYELDLEGRVTYANNCALDTFGFTLRDIAKGLTVANVIHPDDLERAIANIGKALQGQGSLGEEYIAFRRDGSTFPIKIYSQGIFDSGVPTGIRGTVIDISDTKQAEDALKKSENYYRTLFENTGTAMVLFGQDAVIRSCNSQYEILSGCSREEVEGKMKWSDFVDPVDLQRIHAYHAKRLEEGHDAPREYEFVFLARGGIRKFVHIVIEVIPGTEDRVCSLIDITDRKRAEGALLKSEARYELVVRGANDGIWDWDLATDAVYFSPRYKEILGYTDEELPNVSDSWKNNVHPDDLDHTIAANDECIEGKVDQFEVEFRMRHKDGSYRWILGRGASEKDENGKVFRLAGTHTDITDRKESEARFHAVFEQAAVGITLASLDGRWIDANPYMTQITGYTKDELVGMPIADITHKDDLESDKQLMARLRSGEVEQMYTEKRYIHKNGHIVWIMVAVTLRRDISGTPLYFQAVISDITDRKAAEKALKESEQRYRDLFTYANDGVYQCSPEGKFINANPSIATILGYASPDELMTSASDIANQCYVNPEDRIVFLDELKKEGSLNQYELQLRRKDGSRLWVSENVRAVYDDAGEIVFYEGFLQDITERKLLERNTQAMYEISKAISTTNDLKDLYLNIHGILGEVIDATNFFIGLLDEAEDRLVFTYFEDEKDDYLDIRRVSDPKTKSLTAYVIRTGEPLLITINDILSPEVMRNIGHVGTPAAVWLGVPLKLRDKTIGAMAVQHYSNPQHYTQADVSFMEAVSEQVALAIERKANEEALTLLNEELESKVEMRTAELQDKASELETANKRLTELDAVKSALVSSVSHELRTPLTSIRGFAKLTGKDFLRYFHPLANDPGIIRKGERIRKNLKIIESEGERLTRLINDFLDINRIESGKAFWNDSFINPCEVIAQAVATLSGAFAAKPGVELIADLPKSVPPIHADPDKIQQVIINLLNNACKFTSKGFVTVTLKIKVDTLIVSVADTGVGIPLEEQRHIFEKFHKSRTGDTIDIKDKGTGLGLAICREIIEHYDGSIWVESEPGAGSTFSFSLPAIPGTMTACSS